MTRLAFSRFRSPEAPFRPSTASITSTSFVADRIKAEQWYADAMGLRRVPELESWAEGGGPLTLPNWSGTVHIALFERPRGLMPCRPTIALSVGAQEFVAWRAPPGGHAQGAGRARRPPAAWSLYFADPDGNPWEITCYQHAIVATLLKPTGT